ncbi:glycosyltransferase family 25 protein [Gymnodinialimonas hymeniacidonis]|uniref:glycosyltransferase family 25 protein n=1 Tax=Gymnodinialimonas hymeniacidonis TaxID=3126508 RepID=UPI0034C6C5FF
MSDKVWPIHIINLADNTARMENVRHQLDAQKLAFERVDAVNGWKLSDQEISKVYDAARNARRHKQDLVPAEIGCYLSHIEAWKRIAASVDPGGIVLEDDFAAEKDLRSVLEALCANRHQDWDIAKLFSISSPARVTATEPLVGQYDIVVPYRVPSTTLGYAITREAAQHLLSHSIPFCRPIDEDHKFFWEHGLAISLVQPNPIHVGEQDTKTGTIGEARRSVDKTGRWRKLRYQLGYQMRLRWHRMRGR